MDNLSVIGRYNVVSHTPTKAGWRSCLSHEPGVCDDIKLFFQPPKDNFYSLWKNADAIWNQSLKTFTSDLVWPQLPSGTKYVGIANDKTVFTTKQFDYQQATHANDYCAPNVKSIDCASPDIVIENLSTKGLVHLVVHTPTKLGWLGCAAPAEIGCGSLSSYNQPQSPYEAPEHLGAWRWDDKTMTWTFNQPWPGLATGAYSIGVASSKGVYKTITINYETIFPTWMWFFHSETK